MVDLGIDSLEVDIVVVDPLEVDLVADPSDFVPLVVDLVAVLVEILD